MKGEDKLLIKLMDGSDNRFIIPVYQRNYDWKEAECKQLYKDLVSLCISGRSSHFFGGIVRSRVAGGRADDYLIIDGQQRLTTVTLMLLAIYNNIKEGNIVPLDAALGKKIWNKYIVDEYQHDQRKIRLKPIKEDCNAFDCIIFKDKDDYVFSSNVTSNYLYFFERIKELPSDVSIDSFYEAIGKLIVIDIFLEQDDDPQLIFESLNSTGLALTEADKIRNFILMGLSANDQELYYDNYWNKVEKNTSYQLVSSFIRDYLTLTTGKITSIDKVYFTFKNYITDKGISIEFILNELLTYSEIYNQIISANTLYKGVNKILKRLNQLDTKVIHPYLFAMLQYARDNSFSEQEIISVLNVIESYIFRRIICSVPTNALNKIFCTLHKDIIKRKGENDTYTDVLVYILQSKESSGLFPKDDEFRHSFISKNIYSMQAKNKIYLFERIENGDSKEAHDIVTQMEEGLLSIEHIMPKTLNDTWKSELGSEFDRIHSDWLNTIANLTLTGYNSKYSNRPFIEKRDIDNGFKDSCLRLNKYLETCDRWTEIELKVRQNEILSKALLLWLYPETKFTPKVREDEFINLVDDFDFKGRGINSFNFMSTLYKTSDWADMIVDIIKLLGELEMGILHKEAINTDNVWFATSKKNNSYKQITNMVYFSTNSNTNTKINILRGLFDKFELDKIELEFGLVSAKQE